MKRCFHCGHALKADQSFCPQCGTKYIAPQAEFVKPVSYQGHQRSFWQRIGLSIIVGVVIVAISWLACSGYDNHRLSITKEDSDIIWLATPDNQTVDRLDDSTKVTYAYRFFYKNNEFYTAIYNLGDTELGDLKLDNGRLTYRSIAKYVGMKEGTYKPSYHEPSMIEGKQKLSKEDPVHLGFKHYALDDDDPGQYQYDSQLNLIQAKIRRRLNNGNYVIGYRTNQTDDNLEPSHGHKGYLVTITGHANQQAVFQYGKLYQQ